MLLSSTFLLCPSQSWNSQISLFPSTSSERAYCAEDYDKEFFTEQINVLRAGIEEATDAVNERIEEDGGFTRSAVAEEGGLTRSAVTEEGGLTRSAVAQDGNVTREHFDRAFESARTRK